MIIETMIVKYLTKNRNYKSKLNLRCALFISWLNLGLRTGTIPVNRRGASVYVVLEGLLLVSPKIFRDFQSQTGIYWTFAQQGVQRKKINIKTQTGNIFTYEMLSNRNPGKVLKGLVLPLRFAPSNVRKMRVFPRLRLIESKLSETQEQD